MAVGSSRHLRSAGGVAPRSDPSPGRSRARRKRGFVGRAGELAALRSAIDVAAEGSGRVVLLVGDAGIGKTRTIEHLTSEVGQRIEVLWGRCDDEDGAPALWPWTQLIRQLTAQRTDRALDGLLGEDAPEIAQIVPAIATRLGVDRATTNAEGASARFRLFAALSDVLVRAATTRPIALVLDDLQNADEPSLQALRFVARDIRAAPIAILAACRPEALGSRHRASGILADLLREPIAERLTLGGLSDPEVAELVAATLSARADGLAGRLRERTGGNPLFLTEFLRVLAEDPARFDAPRSIDAALPDGVQIDIRRRLSRLSAACADLLRVASVFGNEFGADALALASGSSLEEISEHLTQACDAGIVEPRADVVERYRFVHSLIRDAAYEDVPPVRRRSLHARVARALEATTAAAPDPPVAEIAAHMLRARDPAGIEFALKAARRALELAGHEEAERQVELALAAVDSGLPVSGDVHCDLLLTMGEAVNLGLDTERAKPYVLRAAQSARLARDRERLSRAALGYGSRLDFGETGEPDREQIALLEEAIEAWRGETCVLHARLLARLAVALYFVPGSSARRATMSEQAVAMARSLGDGLDETLVARHTATWRAGGTADRLAIADELVALGTSARNRHAEFEGRLLRSWDNLELGRGRELASDLAACTQLAALERDPLWAATCEVQRGVLALMTGRVTEVADALGELQKRALMFPVRQDLIGSLLLGLAVQSGTTARVLNEVLALRTKHGHKPVARIVESMCAAFLAEGGRVDEAAELYDALVPARLDEIPDDCNRIPSLAYLAIACQVLAIDRGVTELYEALLPHADLCVVLPHKTFLGSVSLYLGMLATAGARWSAAEEHFARALAVHAQLGSPFWLARARTEYARMLLQRAEDGDRLLADRLLEQARSVARELSFGGIERTIAEITGEADRRSDSTSGATQPSASEPARPPDPPARRDEAEQASFLRCGDVWKVAFDDHTVHVPHLLGLGYLVTLLREPGREFHVTALVGETVTGTTRVDSLRTTTSLGEVGPVIDTDARNAYRARLVDLRDDLAAAESRADAVGVLRARREIEALEEHLLDATRRGRASAHVERARQSVAKALDKAIRRIEACHPSLGEHLVATIQRGYWCRYRPDTRRPIHWAT